MKHGHLGKILAGVVLAGCGGLEQQAPTTVEGTVDSASFPVSPVAVEALSDRGAIFTASLQGDGAFSLGVESGHVYRLRIALTSGAEPLVFPRPDGSLDLDFKVKGGGASVALGAIRYFEAAPPEGFGVTVVRGEAPSSCAEAEDDEVGDDDSATGGAEAQDDGEQEDDVDATLDPSHSMAVPEFTAPNTVDGCAEAEDGEEED